MHPIVRRIIMAMVLSAAASTVMAEDVTIKVVGEEMGNSKTPVPIVLKRRVGVGDGVPLNFGPPEASLSFPESTCTLDVSYLAVPAAPSLFSANDEWQTCRKDKTTYTFTFSRVAGSIYSQLAREVVSLTQPTTPALNAAELKQGLAVLYDLSAKGDYGSVSYVSNEMAIALAKSGQPDTAEYFRFLALSSGADAAVAAAGQTGNSTEPLISFSGPQPFTHSPTALADIQSFQAKIGVEPNGKLDWDTLRSLSQLARDNPVSLNYLKRTAISPICASCALLSGG